MHYVMGLTCAEMLSLPQRKEKVPPSPLPGLVVDLGGVVCWGLRMPVSPTTASHGLTHLVCKDLEIMLTVLIRTVNIVSHIDFP